MRSNIEAAQSRKVSSSATTRTLIFIALGALSAGMCMSASADDTPRNESTLSTGINIYANATTIDNVASGGKNAAEISAGTGDKTAGLTLPLSSVSIDDPASMANIVLAAPLDSTNTGTSATLDSLSTTYNATLNYKHVFFDHPTSGQLDDIERGCWDLAHQLSPGYTGPSCGTSVLRDLYANSAKNGHQDPALAKKIDDYSFLANGTPFVVGLLAKLGTNDYSYLDASTVTQQKSTLTSWGVGGYAGIISTGAGMFVLADQWQSAIKAAGNGALCKTPIAGKPITCMTGAIGVPQRIEKNIVSLYWYDQFSSFGLSPTLSYDTKGHTFGIDLPVYFLTGSDASTAHGIRIGWRSDTHELTGTIFIGVNFNYL